MIDNLNHFLTNSLVISSLIVIYPSLMICAMEKQPIEKNKDQKKNSDSS